MMQKFLTNFLKGLLVLVPLMVTTYVLYFIFIKIDGLLHLRWPGLGFVITILFVSIVGFLASNIFFKKFMEYMERALTRLPLVKILYFSIKDLINAFVGEKKSFNRPVVVTLIPEGGIKILGFVTQESLDFPGTENYVSVYLPQSYNYSANLILVPRDRITPLPAQDSAKVMTFIISGGVSKGSLIGAPLV